VSQRAELVAAARQLQAQALNSGTAGNLSLRREEGMLITPSGVPYQGLVEDDLVHMAMDGSVLKAASGRKPSSEWRFHSTVYLHCPAAGAVVHTHSTFATALACMGRGIPAFHYEVAFAGGKDIRCAPYATFGTAELAEHMRAALQGRRACLLANHGLVAWGETLERAMDLAIKVEHLAQMYTQCLQMGEPQLLDDEEMARVVEKFRHYGAPA
jgi:L-fuculose-phosphate aldolase